MIDTFANEFLHESAVDAKTWLKENENRFRQILAEKLRGTTVKWINPVALIMFEHPRTIISNSKAGSDWAAYLSEALYMPLAICEEDQEALDRAFLPITDEGNKDRGHLTPFFTEQSVEKTLCFKCDKSHDGDEIEIYVCSPTESDDTKIRLSDVSHYSELFEISNNTIWFIPTPLFSLQETKSKLHKEYLVGAYLGLREPAESSSCLCSGWENDRRIQEGIGWATNLFFLRRLKDQANEFHKVLEEYSKQLHMLRRLEAPLRGLSEALEHMQEDTQTLRSVLYDPHRSLFAVAPSVADYFEEDRWCSYGHVRWQAIHKPDALKTRLEKFSAAATISAICCHVFGVVPKGHEDDKELYGRVVALLESGDRAFVELRGVLELVLFGDNSNGENRRKREFLSQLCDLLMRPDAGSGDNLVLKALKNLKLYVFTPFKYGGDTPIGPVALILYDHGYRGEINKIACEKILGSPIKASKPLFRDVSLPVPRYSDVLSLISGILAYSKSNYNDVEAVHVEGNSVNLVFRKEIFRMSELRTTFELMKTVAKEGFRKPQGNFRKPLLDFCSLLEVVRENIERQIEIGEDTFSIFLHDCETVLKFSADAFSISIKGQCG